MNNNVKESILHFVPIPMAFVGIAMMIENEIGHSWIKMSTGVLILAASMVLQMLNYEKLKNKK